MILLAIVAAAPTAIAPPGVLAPWAPGRPINTAQDIQAACQSPAKSAGKLACFYFVNGVINDASTSALVAAKQQGKPASKLYCVPPATSFDTQIGFVTSAVSQNPKLRLTPAAYVVRVVYGKNWLCQPPAAGGRH